MAKMKTFLAATVLLPSNWATRVNTRTHHLQGDVMIVAATKAAAVKMLVAAGVGEAEAKYVIRECRVHQRDVMPSHEASMVAAGVVDLDQPGAYAWRRAGDGLPIARVDAPGLPIVGIFRHVTTIDASGRHHRIDVEPFTEVPR
jgi:hypothetical protein